MIGRAVLLYPDTGPDFLRSLAATVLYAEEVRVFTVVDEAFAKAMLEALEPLGEAPPLAARRVADYVRFVSESAPILKMLHSEGVLTPLIDGDGAAWSDLKRFRRRASDSDNNRYGAGIDETTWQEYLKKIEPAFDMSIPCLSDLDFMSASIKALEGNKEIATALRNQEVALFLLFHLYLLIVNAASESTGAIPVSWHPAFQGALHATRDLYLQKQRHQDEVTAREYRAGRLAQTVISRNLPRADDLPFDVILRLRQDRGPELESLRVALRELALQIDLDEPERSVDEQIADLVESKVDPVVDQLRRGLAASRLEAFCRLGRSSSSAPVRRRPDHGRHRRRFTQADAHRRRRRWQRSEAGREDRRDHR